MEFFLEKNSSLAPHNQIMEQIKVALLLGNLRPGEILPSIRDLEKDLGISRSIVRKAYLELEEQGILKLIQGKGVMVNKSLRYREDRNFLQNCERLVQNVRRSCRQKGLVFSSFSRFLYQKAIELEKESAALIYVDVAQPLARERADELGKLLQVRVHGLSTEELTQQKAGLEPGVKVVCNFYRLDLVSRSLRGKKVEVVPLRMRLADETLQELAKLPDGSRILFLFDPRDQSATPLIMADYRRANEERELEFVTRPVKDVERQTRSDDFSMIIISNRLWASLPVEIREADRVTHPILSFDLSSVEESRMQLGITG